MNIWVTGAGGQLGSELREVAKGSEDTFFYTTSSQLNIADTEGVYTYCKANGIELIINCAAYTNVDGAESNIELAEVVNTQAVGGLAKVCRELAITLFHISTDYVFGGSVNTPLHEDDETEPLGVYGKTKRRGEELICSSGCDYLIFRTAWLYAKQGKNFLKTMLKLTATKEEVQVVVDQVGSPTSTTDLAELLIFLITKRAYRGKKGIYHYTNEGVCSWFDFAWTINELAGHGCVVKPCSSAAFPTVVRRPSYAVLSKTKIKKCFGIEIPYWRTSLVKCLKKIENEI